MNVYFLIISQVTHLLIFQHSNIEPQAKIVKLYTKRYFHTTKCFIRSFLRFAVQIHQFHLIEKIYLILHVILCQIYNEKNEKNTFSISSEPHLRCTFCTEFYQR